MSQAAPGLPLAAAKAAPAPAAPKGRGASADPDWLGEVVAREQRQAAWAEGEKKNWEAARDAAVAAAEGGTLTARSAGGNLVPEASPLLLDGAAADPTSPGSDELAALMCGRLALLALQQITRPPGLAVFCSSTVRHLRPPRGHAGDFIEAPSTLETPDDPRYPPM